MTDRSSEDSHPEAGAGAPASTAVDPLEERLVESRVIHRGRYLELRIETIERADGSRAEREIVGHPGAVAILALDPDDRVLLVRQWRAATGRALLEIPAGTLDVDESGSVEDPDTAARRELEEETGYRAATWERLASFWTAPGFATELMHLYLATDLSPAHDDRLGPDEDERLTLEAIPWREAVELAERGEISDAKSLIGLLKLARLRERSADATAPATTGAAVTGGLPGRGESVSARFLITRGDVIRGSVAQATMSRASLVFGALLIILAIPPVLAGDLLIALPGLLFGIAMLTGVFLVPIVWWHVRRRPELFREPSRLVADDAGLLFESPFGKGRYEWSTFRRVRERRGFLFLDTGVGASLMLPLHALEPQQVERLRRILGAHLGAETTR